MRLGNRIGESRLSGFGVARVVKKRLPKDVTRFGGHSLRAGFVASACAGGAALKSIMKTTGHKSLEMVLKYRHDCFAETRFRRSVVELFVRRNEARWLIHRPDGFRF